ncbi:MAG TPA: serine/threonine-protein kinase, partial [Phycisphaerae bacterium]|nr:serine/threonine-protein kinase [Phycisphaerae bacterium]
MLTPARHARIKEIFLEVCNLAPPEAGARISALCGRDEELARDVKRLFDKQAKPGNVAGAGDAIPERDELPDFPPGHLIAGRYRIAARLGEGGIGRVFSAEDTRLGTMVALKFLPRYHTYDPILRRRVEEEVKVARGISHPNICRIHDIGEADGLTFISMEYVQGEDLRSLLLKVGRLTGERAIEIARQICIGLAAAHQRGVIHRDLKPANVMIDEEGRTVITDFGLALLKQDIDPSEILAGTPRYMAPEQLGAGLVSEKSDIYSLGLVLYEMFTGKPALDGDGVLDYLRLHRSVEPTPPSEVVPDISRDVEAVILACLRKDPADRPASALHVAAALPGGDLIGAALASGGLPTGEMVADAAAKRRLAPRAMYGAAALFGLLLCVVIAIGVGTHPVARKAVKSPEVLLEKARQVVSAAGFHAAPTDYSGRFGSVREWASLPQLRREDGEGVKLGVSPDVELLFLYRAWFGAGNDEPVMALPLLTMEGGPEASSEPTSLLVILDGAGRLLFLESNARSPANEKGSVDWKTIFRLAGLQSDESREKALSSDMSANRRNREHFVTGRTDSNEPALNVSVDARDSGLEYFAVFEPAKGEAVAGPSQAQRRAVVNGIRNSVFLVLFAVAMPVAWLNSKRGGDKVGAARLGAFVFAVRLIGSLLAIRSVGEFPAEIDSLLTNVIGALSEGVIVAILYLALETHVRRIRPRTLGSWNRVLTARVDDPYLGRDILAGCIVGLLWAGLLFLDRRIPILCGWATRDHLRIASSLDAVLGPRFGLSALCRLMIDAIYQSLILVMLLVSAEWTFKGRRAVAVIATWFIAACMYAPAASHWAT